MSMLLAGWREEFKALPPCPRRSKGLPPPRGCCAQSASRSPLEVRRDQLHRSGGKRSEIVGRIWYEDGRTAGVPIEWGDCVEPLVARATAVGWKAANRGDPLNPDNSAPGRD